MRTVLAVLALAVAVASFGLPASAGFVSPNAGFAERAFGNGTP